MLWIKSLALTFVLGIAAVSFAENAPAASAEKEKPAKEAKEAKVPKVTGVWAKIDGLTDEQKTKIYEIHRKALADKRKIEEQEETDITALLTDEQKAALGKLKDEETAARKAKAEKAAAEKLKEKPE